MAPRATPSTTTCSSRSASTISRTSTGACSTTSRVWDVAVERQVEITGPDAFAFTNLLTPRDLDEVRGRPGQVRASSPPTTAASSTTRADAPGREPLLAGPGRQRRAAVGARRGGQLRPERQHHASPTSRPCRSRARSPRTSSQALFGDRVLELQYYYFLETDARRHPGHRHPHRLDRRGRLRNLPARRQPRRSSSGSESWRPASRININPTGPSDIRRIEAGILNWGADMTLENNPYEVGLGWLVDDDKKADYIGKEALRAHQGARASSASWSASRSPATRIDFNITKWPVATTGEAWARSPPRSIRRG